MSTVIQVRVDDELKKEVTELFNELGLDLSNAIRLFLRACVQRGGIPFEMKSKRTIEIEEAAARAIEAIQEQSEKNGNCNMTLDEINEIIRLAREEREKKWHS